MVACNRVGVVRPHLGTIVLARADTTRDGRGDAPNPKPNPNPNPNPRRVPMGGETSRLSAAALAAAGDAEVALYKHYT